MEKIVLVEPTNKLICENICSYLDVKAVSKKILVKTGAAIRYFLWLDANAIVDVEFVLENESSLDFTVVLTPKDGKINSCVDIKQLGKKSSATMYSACFLTEKCDVSWYPNFYVDSNADEAFSRLSEENIFLGVPKRFVTVPALDVHCNNVRASHGAKVHRLPQDATFYVQSRGISEQDAQILFVESYVNKAFSVFTTPDDELLQSYKKEILSHVFYS